MLKIWKKLKVRDEIKKLLNFDAARSWRYFFVFGCLKRQYAIFERGANVAILHLRAQFKTAYIFAVMTLLPQHFIALF